jgi:hypothetical protein
MGNYSLLDVHGEPVRVSTSVVLCDSEAGSAGN